ncbi:MAG: protein arginine kinase [Oscillospiraceae bacterium]|nr:protein arginine kinase [Oscillospiraceae bacterium]
MSTWYEKEGAKSGIVLSTRVRLARNYTKYPFPNRMTDQQRQSLLDETAACMTAAAGGQEFTLRDLTKADPAEARSLMEQHLISPELAAGNGPRGVILSREEDLAVMVGEEDHLRIQAMGAGLCLDECLKRAMQADDLLESVGSYAFSDRMGYLTQCPTNLGTGLRASVMLHLPALTAQGYMRGVINAAGKMGFAVRGIYGEGSRFVGDLYQFSNQATLGLSEEEIVRRLEKAVDGFLEKEEELRAQLKNDDGFLDRVWRAAGLLASARSISSEEAMSALSLVREGAACGVLPNVTMSELNRLLVAVQPATLNLAEGGRLDETQRDKKRADLLRSVMGKVLR